jgi:hypothetical protein
VSPAPRKGAIDAGNVSHLAELGRTIHEKSQQTAFALQQSHIGPIG